jgi:endonuclease YncB( thermonuclease family)
MRRRVIVQAAMLACAGISLFGIGDRLAASERFSARVEHVPDGDSLTVRAEDGRRLKIRLAGIDAPEIGQPHGEASRDHLRTRIGLATIEIRPVKTDFYGRLVARVTLEGEDLALTQILKGHAWHFDRYASDQSPREERLYRAAQGDARLKRIGLWQHPDPTPPWDYRSAERRR